MENKKTKLSISGTAKKSIKNIEKAKTQGKNSVIIEKSRNNYLKKGLSSGPQGSVSKSKPQSFNRGTSFKSSLSIKTSDRKTSKEKLPV